MQNFKSFGPLGAELGFKSFGTWELLGLCDPWIVEPWGLG